ncbi:uncharacterized protein LOC128931851 [Callithrix jacchus]
MLIPKETHSAKEDTNVLRRGICENSTSPGLDLIPRGMVSLLEAFQPPSRSRLLLIEGASRLKLLDKIALLSTHRSMYTWRNVLLSCFKTPQSKHTSKLTEGRKCKMMSGEKQIQAEYHHEAADP